MEGRCDREPIAVKTCAGIGIKNFDKALFGLVGFGPVHRYTPQVAVIQ
jgi:hypothetical protein